VFVRDNSINPSQTRVPVLDKKGRPVLVPGKNPNEYRQPQDSFMAYVEALIESTSSKTLASPTLLVQEGNSATVRTGTSFITDVTETVSEGGVSTFTTTRQNAGLSLLLNVDKIDDNGFVTLSVNPEISVPDFASRVGQIDVYNITSRFLDSGSIRLRDRQTLVLTGVIQDQDVEVVRKWPILGDLPLLGQMFRGTSSSREKQELVILVTPSIVDDEDGGTYGYGYRPSTREARQLMRSR
jgi:type IV pilus assembly protein PilQ